MYNKVYFDTQSNFKFLKFWRMFKDAQATMLIRMINAQRKLDDFCERTFKRPWE